MDDLMQPGHRSDDLERRAEELRHQAAELRTRAEVAAEAAFHAVRGSREQRWRRTLTPEQLEFRDEQERSARELAEYIGNLRREQEMLRREVQEQDAWFRGQVLAMLEQGWTRAELGEIGFEDAFLAQLGLADHPALRKE